MNKVQNLTATGMLLLSAGVVMLVSENIGVDRVKLLIPLLFIIGGVFSILFSRANAQIKGIGQYQLIHGIGLVVFGIIFGLIPKTLAEFLKYATYFILAFGLLEIIIGFTIVNSDFNFKWGDVIARFFAGLFGSIGGVLILATSATDQFSGLMITGGITILIGLGIVLFSMKLKKIIVKYSGV